MKPDAPHSFLPRNPSTADGRTTCECGLRADADCHLRAMLAISTGSCRDCLEKPAARKGRCWKCYKATLSGHSEVTLSTTLSPALAAAVDRARGGVSRSAWIREVLVRELGAAAE